MDVLLRPAKKPNEGARSVAEVTEHNRLYTFPIEDRRRELIAARHTARVQRAYGSQGAAATEPSVPSEYLTSEEVIGLIAFGYATAAPVPVPDERPLVQKWNYEPPIWSGGLRRYPWIYSLRWLIARVRWWRTCKRLGRIDGSKLQRLHPTARARIRWALRTHGKPATEILVSLAQDVRQMLAARNAHEEPREEALARASQILCQEIAAGRICAWGRPGVWRSRQLASGLHELIPNLFFSNPRNTILPDGWATCGWDAAARDLNDWKGPDWGDVRFKRDEVFALLLRVLGEADLARDDRARWFTILEHGQKPIGAIPNKPGFAGRKKAEATAAMIDAVEQGRVTFDALQRMKQKQLADLYPSAGRTVLAEARKAALAKLAAGGPT